MITTDAFQIARPGVNGGAPVPIFTTGLVSGLPKIGIRGDVIIDGTLTGTMIQAGTVNTIHLAAQSVTAGKIQTGSITSASGVIGALSVESLSIGDNAVTVPAVQTLSNPVTGTGGTTMQLVNQISMAVNTVGLAGKPVAVIINWNGVYGFTASSISVNGQMNIYVNGGLVKQDAFVSTLLVPSSSFSDSIQFSATGGTDVVQVDVLWDGSTSGGTITLGPRTVWAMTAKR